MRRPWPLLGSLALLALAGGAQAAAGLENPALLEDHAPLRIDSDADFDAAHGVRGGNGTAEDPFLIAHWRINTTEQHVRIANTTKAWVVRNVELNGQCDTGGNASTCLFEAGIYLENVVGGTVLHNQLTGMDRTGINLERSRGVEVVENLLEGGAAASQGTGILVHQSPDVQVRGNRLERQGPVGSFASAAMRIWDSNDTLVQGNDIRGATEAGLNLLSSRRTIVEDNTLSGNRIGIAAQGRDAVVRYNNIGESGFVGILLNFGFMHLERNDLSFNRAGLDIASGVANATMRENNVQGNTEFGVRLFNTARADARENYWGAANGPDVNHTGPGSGALVVLNHAQPSQFAFQPFLTERVSGVGAFGPRPGRTIVTGGGSGGGGGGGGGPVDPAPVAVFEGPGDAFLGQAVEFSAALSFDPEGGALRYAWDLGDGTTAAGLRARHAYAQAGEYVVRLTVTDPTGLSGTASAALRVTRAPFAVALLVNATAARGEELELRAVVSGQLEAPPLFRFTTSGPGTFTGEPSLGNVTRVRLTEPREYLLGVEARAGNETRTAFQRVLVGNRPPVARLSAEPEQPTTDDDVRLSAAASTDADGDPLTFAWDFGGGETASGANVTRRFTAAGLHVVQLTVSDGFASASEQRALDVRPGTGAGDGAKPTPGLEGAAALALLALAALARRRPRR